MKITHCQIAHLTNPLGYALDRPVFSWQVEEAAGKGQSAARIRVFREGTPLADTGWADLDALATPLDVSLTPRTRYTWTVAVRTDAGEEARSGENTFETAKEDEPWQAMWIGCDDTEPRHPIFSREVIPEGTVVRARLYICGLGLYEAAWNGRKIGQERLTPYCTAYDQWMQYQTYDITELLQSSGTLSVTLRNGWYKGRFGPDRRAEPVYGTGWKLLAELRLTYDDGRQAVLGTDESWQVTRSNITFSNIYDGEHRDDTLPPIPPVPAVLVTPPEDVLSARRSTPVQTRMELPVRALLHTPAGEIVLDLGQNLTGGFRLRLHVPAGREVRLQFGEILQNGNFYRENLRTAKAEYRYVSDGQPHTLESCFTFYGYRYVKVDGIDDLHPEDFTTLLWHSELPRAEHMVTGHPLVNRLLENAQWSQVDNFLDVPTDCPQRDERMGWTGDAQVFASAACYQRQSYSFFAKYLHDLAREQQALGGMVPDVVPRFGKTGCSAAWGGAACIIPWTLYEFYGDDSILRAQYPSMAAWVDYVANVDGTDHGWRRHFHYGDWLALDAPDGKDQRGGTDVGYVADAMFLRSARLTAKAARVLGRTAEAERYEALAGRILTDIRREYFTATGRCAVPTQTGHLLALMEGLSPDPARIAADLADRLKKDGNQLRTGFVGTPLLCAGLTATGHSERAYDLLLSEEYPGWLYAVKLGATTVWERWDSVAPDGVIAENGMNSLNHYAYGSVAAWLYRDAAGITPAAPGFRRALLRPNIDPRLGSIHTEFRSAAGLWKVRLEVLPGGEIAYRCTVPFGCTAELTLPSGGGTYTLEAGDFERVYTPDRPLRTVLSTNTPVGELMDHPAARRLLQRVMPQIVQLPPSMHAMTMRQIATRMGGGNETQLRQLDALLAKI